MQTLIVPYSIGHCPFVMRWSARCTNQTCGYREPKYFKCWYIGICPFHHFFLTCDLSHKSISTCLLCSHIPCACCSHFFRTTIFLFSGNTTRFRRVMMIVKRVNDLSTSKTPNHLWWYENQNSLFPGATCLLSCHPEDFFCYYVQFRKHK